MEPTAFILAATLGPRGAVAAANPFFASTPPPLESLAWAAVWVVALLALAAWSFERREL